MRFGVATFLLAAVALAAVRAEKRLGPDERFKITLAVDLPADDGGSIGTLFEVRDANGTLLAGAGFGLANNSTQTINPRMLSVYFRRSGGTARITDLGKPFPEAVPAHLLSLGTNLVAVPYNAMGLTPKVFDARRGAWRDLRVPLKDPFVALLGIQAVRGVPLLLYNYSRASRYSSPLIYYGERQIETPATLHNTNATDLYFLRNVLYLFLHDRVGYEPRVAACRWAPSDRALTDCRLFALPAVPFFYALTPDPNGDGLLFFDRAGRVFSATHSRFEQLHAGALDGASGQIYAALRFRDGLLLGHYPSGSVAWWDPLSDKLPYTFVTPRVSIQDCSTQNLREAQTLTIFNGRVIVGTWPFGELWEGLPGEPWSLLARPFRGSVCGDAPYMDRVLTNGGGEKNILGQRIWGMANWSTGLAFSTAAKHSGAAEYFYLLNEDERDSYGRVFLLERDLELACEIPGSGQMALEISNDRLELRIRQRLPGKSVAKKLCAASTAGMELVMLDGALTLGSGLWGPFAGSISRLNTHSMYEYK